VSQINKLKIFNDPIYGFITSNALIYDLIQHPYFQRHKTYFADGIVISGLSELITRGFIALGCMHLMQEQLMYCVLKALISKEEENALYIAILLHA
jgi:HD superfamily phosphohydrolase